MDTYAEAGGNFLDTAHIYAAWLENGVGASERTVGAWVRSRGLRDQVIIGTKGGHPPLDAMDQGRLAAKELNQDLNESLERLGMDCVDIYWLHRDDPACDLAELIETLSGFVADGRIRTFGASNWSVERIAEANAWAEANGHPGFTANQPGWSLAVRDPGAPPLHGMLSVDEATKAWHAATQMPLAAYTSRAGGYFSGDNVAWAREGYEGPCPHGADFDSQASRTRLRVAAEIGNRKGYQASQIALAYLLHQPFPVYPIIGTGNPGRVQSAMTARKIVFTDRELERLEVTE
jgi:aryl-alcohol dehydrogenase-like predicted oxidoreductase